MSTLALEKSLKIFELFQEIDSSFPLHYALCLHHIALTPALSVSDLSNKTGIQISTVSRIVGALSEWRKNGSPYGLVQVKLSPNERRKRELYLTKEGEALITNLAKILKMA